MTSFEFVFGLISVITSLALTQMLSHCVALIRNFDRVRFSWRHACWAASAFMLLIGNWAAFWHVHNVQTWPMTDVLIRLTYVGILYAFCELVMPEAGTEGPLDLREYHAREGHRYKLLLLVFTTVVILALVRSATGFVNWLEMAKFAILAEANVLLALRARSVRLDTATAVVQVALTLVYMMSTLKILSS